MNHEINRLIQFALDKEMITKDECDYSVNLLLDLFDENDFEYEEINEHLPLATPILEKMLDHAVTKGLIEDNTTSRDLFDTKIMNCIMPRPHTVNEKFKQKYMVSPKVATDYYYKLSIASNYIRKSRTDKNIIWKKYVKYGNIEISINLSKPEKDPKEIAKAKLIKSSGYPKCLLCKENVGFSGDLNRAARQTHRIIPIELATGNYYLQYSPYVYYNEHCIVFNGRHIPMKIEKETFVKLFDFVKMFPHYFLGSNADLPIVGGSILSHDHFQGGHYTFAMAKAPIEKYFKIKDFEDVETGIVYWPMSVLRTRSGNPDRLIELGEKVLAAWRDYTDEAAFVFARTEGEPHNTITPIARRNGDMYELDLVLRNNITTEEFPLGVFHPHQELHHIKKENIGLIEVMGLAVLPSRLKDELALLGDYIVEGRDIRSCGELEKHAAWVEEFLPKYEAVTKENVEEVLKNEVGLVFERVLEDAGVYKCTEEGRAAFARFLNSIGAGEV